MIVYDGGGAPGARPISTAPLPVAGHRNRRAAALADEVKVSASYTYLRAKATDDGGLPSATFAAGARLIRRPAHSAELAVRGRFDRLTWEAPSPIGSRDDVDFNRFPASGWSSRPTPRSTWRSRWSCPAWAGAAGVSGDSAGGESFQTRPTIRWSALPAGARGVRGREVPS